MKIFGPVLLAILIAAGIIGTIVAIKSQLEATENAETAFQKQMAHTDAYLKILKSVHTSPSPWPSMPSIQISTPLPTPFVVQRQKRIGPSTVATPTAPQFVTLTNNATIQVRYGSITLQKERVSRS